MTVKTFHEILQQIPGLRVVSTPEPSAPEDPTVHREHGRLREDPYYWMRNREDSRVLTYLEQENAFLEEAFGDLRELRETLFQEMRSRIPENDESVPILRNGSWYYHRFIEGGEYPIYCRRVGSLSADEEILLDVNQAAQGFDFFQVGQLTVSDDGGWLAYTADRVGRRQYTLILKNLESGSTQETGMDNLAPGVCWSAGNEVIYFVRNDPETLRSWQVCRAHRRAPQDVEVIFEELDDAFHVSVGRSRCRKFIVLESDSTLSSEVLYLDAADTASQLSPLIPRRPHHLYNVEFSASGEVFVRTNLDAEDFRLVRVGRMQAADPSQWEEVFAHRPGELLVDFEVFDAHLAVMFRRNGIDHLFLSDCAGGQVRLVEFQESAYCVDFVGNSEPGLPFLRVQYSSMTTPNTTLDIDLKSMQRTVRKVQKVGENFESHQYVSKRLYARARDGAAVALSLVAHRDTCLNSGTAPVLLYGYGSYGHSILPYFSSLRLSLLDRGFVFAIAHVRGSETFGRRWYEDGKLLKKKNTFFDFIDCAEHLVTHRYAAPKSVYAMGGSAGGLLMGAVMNERPDLFAGIVAQVPFVDVVTTMLDESIPLTTFEYDEWGNPNTKEYFDYMLSYSPYDNVKETEYPPLLVVSGFHDSQVQYWEPAKWVARLRKLKKGNAPLYMKMDMSAGHGGKSGRYEYLRDMALEYAFLLALEGEKRRTGG